MTIAAVPVQPTHQAQNAAAVSQLVERLTRAAAGVGPVAHEKQPIMPIEALP